MTRLLALTLAAITAGSLAHASDTSDMALDTAKTEQIKTQLTADGYDVRKVEVEDGMYEAYALKDGKKYEIYLDADLKVIKTEMDD